MTEKTPDLESFEDFSGKFIKAEMVKSFPVIFIPISVKSHFDEEENAHLTYTGEIEGKKKDWEANKTNIQIIKDLGFKSPKDLIAKKVYFKKVMNFNPQLKKKVPALEIDKIEG